MNGLHSCKPGNEPQVGQIKNFIIIENPARDGKKAWTKIKSASADQGGTPHAIRKVTPTGYTDSYGNVSFNLEVEPANGAPESHVGVQRTFLPNPSDDRSNRIERQHSQEMAIRYAALKGKTDVSTDDLRKLIDWFQRDVGRSPVKEPEPQVEDDAPPPDEEESF